MSRHHTLLALLALALPAGLAAFGAGPGPDDSAAGRRRFRVEVRSSRPAPGADVLRPTVESLGLTSTETLRPVASRPRAAGWVGAAVTSPEIFAAIAARPGAEAIFRFETECGVAEDARSQVSRESPANRTDIRGDQRIQTTIIQRVGAPLRLRPGRDDGSYRMEFALSGVSAMVPGAGAQILAAKSTGTLALADGTTGIFAFTDRVDAENRRADASQVVEYLFLLTRLDPGE